jgi:hypothetical protein
VSAPFKRHRRKLGLFAGLATTATALVLVLGGGAASLPGSVFEIDGVPSGANFVVNTPGNLDWANVDNISKQDRPTGQTDDSYQGGTKEDTVCPGEVTGSIPNNKSDLKTYMVYKEDEANGPGFLNLGWIRVNDPSGTTLMDFELNHSSTPCAVGPNVQRTVGDLLIEYAIDQGGAVATITSREWNGSAWGAATPLPAQAIGTINLVPIPANQTGGESSTPLAARTFGEMSLDLDFIFDPGVCESFGSTQLKSRSSDAFNSQLKDFIRPVPINLSNCGKVIVRKQTNPDENPNVTQFDYTKAFSTAPPSGNTFQLTDDGVKTFDNVIVGNGYTVHEDDLPTGWDFESLDCSASTGTVPVVSGRTATFDVGVGDVVDCTYTNRARGSLTIRKITDDGSGAFDFSSNTLTPAAWTLTTTQPGAAGQADRDFNDLAPGTYDAAESVPAGWHLVSATCDDQSPVSAISVSGGEHVTCTFHNARNQGAIDILKLRKHAADGPGDHPQAGVTFTVTGGELPIGGVTAITDALGQACVGGLVASSFVGDYTVTETLPGGYHSVGPLHQDATVGNAEATCSTGSRPLLTFHNMPLTDLTISLNSQVNGGTASSWTCDNGGPNGSTGANGDGSSTASDLEPVEIHCTIIIDP